MTWICKSIIAAEAEKKRWVLKREVEGFSNNLKVGGKTRKNKVRDNTTLGLVRGKGDNSRNSNRDLKRMGLDDTEGVRHAHFPFDKFLGHSGVNASSKATYDKRNWAKRMAKLACESPQHCLLLKNFSSPTLQARLISGPFFFVQ